jgi:predicted dehydrogenase
MKFAVLGTDEEILRLVAAALVQGHEITWLGDVRPEDAAEIRRLCPRSSDRASDWELLLDRAIADAVLVGRGNAGDDLRAEQLKRLATEAVPMLAVHPATSSVLTYYELDMIRRETGGILRHFNPLAANPVLVELASWVRDGHPDIGPIRQVACERRLGDTAAGCVLKHLARDVELLAATSGDIRRVSAIGPRADDASFASLQAQMTSDGPATLRWSIGAPADLGPGLEVRFCGERGTVALQGQNGNAQDAVWLLETSAEGMKSQESLDPFDAPSAAIQGLVAAVNDAEAQQRASTASTWDAATRAMEVVDAVTLSLEKGRTIDVFQQQLTERLAFRGAMSALGCGLLILGFVAIVVVTLIGGIEGAAGQRLVPFWPSVLVGLLAVFLLLQALPLLASKSNRRGKT